MKNYNALEPNIAVDYRSHPAFAPFQHGLSYDAANDPFMSVFRELDEIWQMVTHSPDPLADRTIVNLNERALAPLFFDLERLSANQIPDSCIFKRSLPEMFRLTRETLFDELKFLNGAKLSEKTIIDAPVTRQTCEDLRTKGVSARVVPHQYIQAVFDLTAPFRQKNIEMRKENPYRVCSNPLKLEGPYWELTSQILKAVGFLDALSLFYGYAMEPLYCTLVHSYPGERWYRDPYEDVGIRTSRCTYMHYDHADDIPKALMYLCEVGFENGPFSVVPGSNRFKRSHSQGIFHKYLDQVGGSQVRQEVAPDNYYHRPHFSTRRYREEFSKLPVAFQGSSHFGDDILDDTPLSNFLLAQEQKFTSDIGNCMLFSGGTTIHRGGMVEKGERWAFQLAFKKA